MNCIDEVVLIIIINITALLLVCYWNVSVLLGTLHFANILPGDSTLANNYACRVTNTILNQMSVGSIKSMTTQVGKAIHI